MRVWLRRIGFVLAAVLVVLTFVNASWLAPVPRGPVKLIADRGVHQQQGPENSGPDNCSAARIEPPLHDYLENTLPALAAAARLGAQMIAVDIASTRDGRIVLFRDPALDCRSNGHGAARDLTLAGLKALDAGYGYTADGGRTFPFRGAGVGAIPTLEEALALLPERPLLYQLESRDPAEADRLAAALKAAGRDVARIGDGFIGAEAPIVRIRSHFPKAWAFSKEGAEACTSGYMQAGWIGVVPDACRNGTLMVPLNRRWLVPGWPNRMLARMADAGARVIVVRDSGDAGGAGIDLPEQLGEIPMDYNGFVWVEDIWAIGPALRPAYNKRNPSEEAELEAALARRRAARDQAGR